MKALIVANWKMNPDTQKDAKKLFTATKKALVGTTGISIIICPPAVFMRELATSSRGGKVHFGVQNIHHEKRGSFTGDISALQARDAKATYAIIGHAERRALGETDDVVRAKVDAAFASNLIPIVCVGEHHRGVDAEHFTFVREQLRSGISEEAGKKLSKIIIAYEPVWAIGAAQPMSPRDMHEMSIFIRKSLVERFGSAGHQVTILYGGAIDAGSAGTMMRDGDVSGLLVGRASVDARSMTDLVHSIAAL